LNKYGEWGMGIDIRDSQNIRISNMKISKMWGDAIYLGNNNNFSNSDIVLSNIIMNDNRRQGVSVITAKNLNANNLTIKNTSGTGPASGIAIEPNNNKSHLENLTFKNITTENNKGAGIQ
ncbi:right-handed parallel beta-helix repeat-containing protein, partial [Acinetobacter baumannii]|nr:right-handed parallel beta-helix repeat-containing protein [Acinetobacter baumannii]